MYDIKVSTHAVKRFQQRMGYKISKKELSLTVGRVMFSQSRRGIKNIQNDDNSIWFRLRIPSLNCIVVIEQDQSDILGRFFVKTVWSCTGDNEINEKPEETA